MHGGKIHQLNTTQFYYIFEIKMTMRSSSKRLVFSIIRNIAVERSPSLMMMMMMMISLFNESLHKTVLNKISTNSKIIH